MAPGGVLPGDAERVDTLSLSDCHGYDSRPSRSGGYLRFRCLLHGGDSQQSLSVEESTGRFRCWSCNRWGTVTEHWKEKERDLTVASTWGASRSSWGQASKPRYTAFPAKTAVAVPLPPPATPIEPNEYAVTRAKESASRYDGSPAQEYARGRGVSDDIAHRYGLGYWRGSWRKTESEWLTFPLRCPVTGRLTGVYGRNIRSNESADKGRLLGSGVFGANHSGPMPDDVLVCEGPFEAVACIASEELPAVRAMMGTAGRAEWFDGCRRVTIIGDDDAPQVDGRIPGKNAVERLMRDIEERYQRRKVAPPILLHTPYGALREMYDVKDLGDLLARGLLVVLNLPPLDVPVAETIVAPPVAGHSAPISEAEASTSELISLDKASMSESLMLEDARHNAMPVLLTNRLCLPSGRLVNDPNVAARGGLDNWRFATEQITLAHTREDLSRWVGIAATEREDISYLAGWWSDHPARIERDLSH